MSTAHKIKLAQNQVKCVSNPCTYRYRVKYIEPDSSISVRHRKPGVKL